MATDKFDYARLVSDIDAKMAALQALRDAAVRASAAGALGEAVEGMATSPATANGDIGQPIDLPEGAFNGKSLPACVELYLSAAKRKKTIKEIAAALKDGGVESTSDNFDNVVTGALFRLKTAGKVLRFKDGWGLPEWYPANIRSASPVPGKRGRKKGKKNGRTNATSPIALADERATDSQPAKGKANERALEYLRSRADSEHSLAAIAEHVGMGTKGARLILGKLIKAGKVRMSAPGMYVVGRPQLVAAAV